jgi:adenylate kinase family enzyme
MKRILVLGSGGSGKTTFSRKLADKTHLPLYHLDALYWKPNWTPTETSEWREFVRSLADREYWIIDGSYMGTVHLRIPRADLIIYLNISPYRCLLNIFKRRLMYARFTGLTRPGMAPECPETIWFSFLKWVWRYPKADKLKVFEAIENLKPESTTLLVFNSYREMDQYLTSRPA